MKFVRGSDQHRFDVFVLQHGFEAVVGVIDLELRRHQASAFVRDIGDRHQAGFRNVAAKIIGVTAAHLSDAQQTYSQLAHSVCSPEPVMGRNTIYKDKASSGVPGLIRIYRAAAAEPRSLTTPFRYFKLAAMFCAGGIGVAPNFTSCSTTDQPE